MRMRNVLVLCVALGVRAASADTIVGLDLAAVIVDGNVVLADDFDDGLLNSPPWVDLGTSSVNESGTLLEMTGGSVIVAPLASDPANLTIARTRMELTSFNEDSLATMVLLGDNAGSLFLGVVPGFAFLADGSAGLLGLVPLPPAATVDLVLGVDNNGAAVALANDEVVFSGATGFAGLTGLGVVVVPEPNSFLIVGIGLVACKSRRNPRSRGWRRLRH